MKYEMIFGDPSQFEGMMPDCEFVDGNYGYKNNGDIFYYCERYNEKFGWAFSHKTKLEFKPIAMRRIIKEPKRWTVEDQKAGRLPEVGVKVALNLSDEVVKSSAIQSWENGDELEVLRTFKKDEPNGKYASALFNLRTKTCCLVLIKYLSPIETPREKYDRERDEWVNSLRNKLPPLNMSFINGMIKAYEELKPFTGDDHD